MARTLVAAVAVASTAAKRGTSGGALAPLVQGFAFGTSGGALAPLVQGFAFDDLARHDTYSASGGIYRCRSSSCNRSYLRSHDSIYASSNGASNPDSSCASPPLPLTNIEGVIFDMDGTITQHCIDFSDMRRRIYAIADDDFGGSDQHNRGCVLALAEKMSAPGQRRAQDVFADIEQKAIENMQFMDGLPDVCRYLDGKGIRRAVLTRNVRRSVDAMHDRLNSWEGVGPFYPAVARDSTVDGGPIPPKPAPDAILHICSVWGCEPSEVIMVGDSAADDIVAGSRARCGGRVLLKEGGVTRDNDIGGGVPMDEEEMLARRPTHTISSLTQLREILAESIGNTPDNN